jgi:hypothetical protein
VVPGERAGDILSSEERGGPEGPPLFQQPKTRQIRSKTRQIAGRSSEQEDRGQRISVFIAGLISGYHYAIGWTPEISSLDDRDT